MTRKTATAEIVTIDRPLLLRIEAALRTARRAGKKLRTMYIRGEGGHALHRSEIDELVAACGGVPEPTLNVPVDSEDEFRELLMRIRGVL